MGGKSILRVGALRRLESLSRGSSRLGSRLLSVVTRALSYRRGRVARVRPLGGKVAGHSFHFHYNRGHCVVEIPKRKASGVVGEDRRCSICRIVNPGKVYSPIQCVSGRGKCGVARFLRNTEGYSTRGRGSIGRYVGCLEGIRRRGLGMSRSFSLFRRVRGCRRCEGKRGSVCHSCRGAGRGVCRLGFFISRRRGRCALARVSTIPSGFLFISSEVCLVS